MSHKKTWLNILIALAVGLFAYGAYILGDRIIKIHQKIRQDDPLFCMTSSNRIYNYDVSPEECLRDFGSQEICDTIKLKKCRECPTNAICSKGILVDYSK